MDRKKLAAVAAIVFVCTAGTVQAQERSASDRMTVGVPAEGGSSRVPAELASYGASYSGAGAADYGNTPKPIGYGPMWAPTSSRDCSRFYHYPYVYYPQNFRGDEYYRSSDSMYYRYPPEMQIPVYNRHWHNYYPNQRRYHWGHHFILDVF
jgi:hypothetical protein